jgi:hypothetical protein
MSKKKKNKTVKITKEELQELYSSGGSQAIADFCKCSIPTAIGALKEAKIPLKKDCTNSENKKA